MEKVYILVNQHNLTTILSNILEIVGFLPIEANNAIVTTKKDKTEKNIIFTNYYYAKYKPEYLKQFKNIVVFVPSGSSFLDTNLEFKDSNIIYFSQTLTVNNVKSLLHELYKEIS